MATALIGALRVTLGLDSAAFERGANRSIRQMDAVERAGFRTGRALRGLAGIAASVGVALAGAFSARAIKASLDYAASIGEVATASGVTTRELQVFRHAATQVNISQEQMDKSLQRLTLTIGKAATGATQEVRAFQALGIAVKDVEGNTRSTGAILEDVADKLQSIQDPAQRAAAAYALFGRQGQRLLPLLENGSEGLQEFGRQAEEAGAIIAEGDIAKADEVADKIEALTKQLQVDFSRVVAQNADSILTLVSALASLVSMAVRAGAAYVDFWAKVGRFAGQVIRDPRNLVGMGDARQSRLTRGGLAGIARVFQPSTTGGADIEGLFNEVPGGRKGAAKRVRDIAGEIRKSLGEMRDDIEDAFSTEAIPRATEEANRLRERFDALAEKAREAGIPFSQFSGEVAALQARIAELETEGLASEADEFSRAVSDMAREITSLDIGALTPLQERLAGLDDRFEHTRRSILEQIDENRVLAESNENAARAMAELEAMLLRLDSAHRKAADAAMAQYEAEQRIADVSAMAAGSRIRDDITSLSQARGDQGFFTTQQLELQRLERELNNERISALANLTRLEAMREEAQRNADADELFRLNGLIALQQEYYDLVVDTTAQQLVTSQRLQMAFEDFTNGLSNALYDMVTQFDFSLKKLADVFLQLLNDIFLRPALENIADGISGALSGLFAGGFASGGVIPRGQWGIVGENGPEPVFAADQALRILPNETLGGGRAVFNITVNGAMSDRDARRTGNQIGAAAARRMTQAQKAGLAGSVS